MQNFKNIKNKKVCVIGAGLSGIHAAVLAADKGANIFLSEGNTTNLSQEHQNLLAEYNIDYELGQHSRKINNADLYIISPGIPKNTEIYERIKKNSGLVISEIEFA